MKYTKQDLADAIETMEKTIIVQRSTIESKDRIIDTLEQLLEANKRNHELDIKLNYIKK